MVNPDTFHRRIRLQFLHPGLRFTATSEPSNEWAAKWHRVDTDPLRPSSNRGLTVRWRSVSNGCCFAISGTVTTLTACIGDNATKGENDAGRTKSQNSPFVFHRCARMISDLNVKIIHCESTALFPGGSGHGLFDNQRRQLLGRLIERGVSGFEFGHFVSLQGFAHRLRFLFDLPLFVRRKLFPR